MTGMPREPLPLPMAFGKSCVMRSTLLRRLPGLGRATATALDDTSSRDTPSVWCTFFVAMRSRSSQWPTGGVGLATGGRDSDKPSNFRMQRAALRAVADPARYPYNA